MMRDAELKRIKHAKKIAELEKKSPIFMDNLKQAITNVRLKQLATDNGSACRLNTNEQVALEID